MVEELEKIDENFQSKIKIVQKVSDLEPQASQLFTKNQKTNSLISDSIKSSVHDKYNTLLRASMFDFFVETYDDLDEKDLKTENMFDYVFDAETDHHFPFD